MGSLLAVLLALSIAAPASGAAPQLDTVVLSSGARVQGTVVEDLPDADLVVLLPDGSARSIPRSQIALVEYAFPFPADLPPPPAGAEAEAEAAPPDGEPPAPAEGAAPPADGEGPPQVAWYGPPPVTAYLAMTFGASIPFGALDGGWQTLAGATDTLVSAELEVGVRATPPLELGAYLHLGVGSARGTPADVCATVGLSCMSEEIGGGVRVRWLFAPGRQVAPWAAGSLGLDWLRFYNADAGIDTFGLTYGGLEAGVSGGVDIWLGPGFALGPYAGLRGGTYLWRVDHGLASGYPWGGAAFHGWVDVGLRVVVGL